MDPVLAEFTEKRPYFSYPDARREPPMINAAVYARVSTLKQDWAMQVTELQGYCHRSNYNMIEYFEHGSGGAGKKREQLAKLMEDARMKRFQIVVVWKMDRFGRSLQKLLENIQTLNDLGIRFISLTDGIDTDNQSPTGRLLRNVMGAFSEFERDIIRERVNAGLAEARKKGKKLGPPRRVFSHTEAEKLRAQGLSWRTIGDKLGVNYNTVRRLLISKAA